MNDDLKDLIDKVPKDLLYNYYIIENHTIKETYTYFNIKCSDSFYKLLNYYNIKKPSPLNYLIAKASKEELIKYYIEENHSHEETINHFNLGSFPQLKKLCKYYDITKKESFKSILKRVSKEDLENYYIFQNHTQKESLKYFNLKPDAWYALLKHYEIKKGYRYGDFNDKPTKDILYDLYITQGLGMKEIASKYHINKSFLKLLLEEYNIPIRSKAESFKIGLSKLYDEKGKENVESQRVKRIQDSLMLRYGVSNINYVPGAIEKRKQTNLRKYGVDSWLKTQECRDKLNKFKEKNLQLKGFSNPNQINLPENLQKLLYNKEESIKFLSAFDKPTMEKIHGCFPSASYTVLQHWIDRLNLKEYIYYNKRGLEDDVEEALISLNINYDRYKNRGNRKTLENGQELDFYFPEYKIAIEINGNYWHSSERLPKNYHLQKSKLCASKGIRLIYIWEYEWNDPLKKEKIISLLKIAFNKVSSRIYARNCEIKQITNKEAKPFNEKNHLQGHRNAQVTYGLFYKGELVQLMSFSKSRWNKNLKDENSWEIIRGCPGSNNIVVGGVSKLFKHFINDYHPSKIFSYCDFNKFDGKGYETIGMKFVGYTGPDMKWLLKNGNVVNRQPKKHKELKENSSFCLWGAGSKKYIWIMK